MHVLCCRVATICFVLRRVLDGHHAAETSVLSAQSDSLTRVLNQMTEADDARWALYYGVKAIAKGNNNVSGSTEAKLFYNFLDEKYGEDELTFFLYWYALFVIERPVHCVAVALARCVMSAGV